MIDGHIHIERGAYTLDWIDKFVSKAVEMGLDEIRLLEHNYIFEEFAPMYDSVRAYSEYVDAWFQRSAGIHKLTEYLELVEKARNRQFPEKSSLALKYAISRSLKALFLNLQGIKALTFCWEASILSMIMLSIISPSIGRGLTLTKYTADISRIPFHWQRADYLTVSAIRTP